MPEPVELQQVPQHSQKLEDELATLLFEPSAPHDKQSVITLAPCDVAIELWSAQRLLVLAAVTTSPWTWCACSSRPWFGRSGCITRLRTFRCPTVRPLRRLQLRRLLRRRLRLAGHAGTPRTLPINKPLCCDALVVRSPFDHRSISGPGRPLKRVGSTSLAPAGVVTSCPRRRPCSFAKVDSTMKLLMRCASSRSTA